MILKHGRRKSDLRLFLPNVLVLLRVALTIVVVVAILEGHFVAAIVALLAAGLTDILDGYAARRWGEPSGFSILDPTADKVLIVATFLTLAMIHAMPWWMVSTVFGRHALVAAAAIWHVASGHRVRVRASLAGKTAMFFQVIAPVLVLCQLAGLRISVQPVLVTMVSLTVWSLVDYIARELRRGSAPKVKAG